MKERQRGFAAFELIIAVAILVGLAIVVIGIYNKQQSTPKPKKVETLSKQSTEYNPDLRPADFTTSITNKYFSISPGKKLSYEAQTPKGLEKVEITIEQQPKNVNGFETLVYHDQVYVADQVVEDTKDYLAQQKTTGDVWYFGEDVDNYQNGQFKDHHGTFLHATDGAKAGIWLKAKQKVGDSYRQEYYKGNAEDMLNVVAVNQTVKTKKATYIGCVKLYAWTPLEPSSKENKYNCPEVAGEVLSQDLTDNKRAELTSVVIP